MAKPSSVQNPNLDSVTTIRKDGSHLALHPADVRGRFTYGRRLFGVLLIAVYALLPWVPIGNFPAVFFDVVNGRFHLFGLTLITQDVTLLFFVISGLGFALFYITALFGRLWCGWACPYTVFLEHVFRRIERLIDGDAPRRRRLDAAKMTAGKFVRRVVKHAAYLIAATLIAHVFLSYFVSMERLYEYMNGSPGEHAKAFTVVAFLSLTLYFCFGWFREQFCIIMCPYGRIQSALTDDDTIVIGYDAGRGEPRGKIRKGDIEVKGDCVDCRRCVQVCPTGIDIRDGLQMECIGCAACVDACDAVMAKIKRPKGLVRYDSLNGLQGRKRRVIRPRIIVYTVLMLIGAGVLSMALVSLQPARLEVIRMKGSTFYVSDGVLRNQFKVDITNKRDTVSTYRMRLAGAPDYLGFSGADEEFEVAPLEQGGFTMVVFMEEGKFDGRFEFEVVLEEHGGKMELRRRLMFLGPDKLDITSEELERRKAELEERMRERGEQGGTP